MKNAITFDVEDWFQLAYRRVTGQFTLPSEEVAHSVERILKILAQRRVKATFFVLGLVAEAFPNLVNQIHEEGHEIASHGYKHEHINEQVEKFRADLGKSIEILEAITGERVQGYRAPFWSIKAHSIETLRILAQSGLRYDSSILPRGGNRTGRRPFHPLPDSAFVEFPPAVLPFWICNISVAKGRYLRALPYQIIKEMIRRGNEEGNVAVIDIHSYELDEGQLRGLHTLGLKQRLKISALHFAYSLNRASVEKKLLSLLNDFEFAPLKEISTTALRQ